MLHWCLNVVSDGPTPHLCKLHVFPTSDVWWGSKGFGGMPTSVSVTVSNLNCFIWKTHEEFLPSFGGEQEHSLGEGPRTDFMVLKSSGVMTILRNEIGE